jgi:uncharacterized surface protein with fasciclin (FAS1) repeats
MKWKLLAGLSLAALLAAVLPAPTEEPKTLGDVIAASKEHTILRQAADDSGLIEELRGAGTWTVFAPTDAAFKRLDKATLERVSGDKELLKSFLRGHVVKGALSSADLAKLDGKEVETLSGTKFKVVVVGKDVTIGGAKLVTRDVKAGNGFVHVIDAALLPPK